MTDLSQDAAWRDFHRRWGALRPPLRPNHEVVSCIAGLVAGRDQRLLLLGVTPELSVLGQDLTSVDWSAEMIARVWPGDGPTRRVVQANWLHLPRFERPFTAAIGDGSFNVLQGLEEYEMIFASLKGELAPGALIAVRCYLAPDVPEPAEQIVADVLAGRTGFHALKWRLAMILVREHGHPSLPVQRIYERFETLFPDRAALSAATGWSAEAIAEIDAYRDSPVAYCFPTAAELLAAARGLEEARLVPAGSYELAQRCPIFAARVPE